MTFRGNGKLLLSGEYVVLDGALGLAVPTRYGQELRVKPIEENKLLWVAQLWDGQVWQTATFDLPVLGLSDYTDVNFAQQLTVILREAQSLNPLFLANKKGFEVTTRLEFHKDWGLGSSSTLIHCVAQWAKIDPYVLLRKTFGGSGYDLACAASSAPLLYKNIPKPISEPVNSLAPFWGDMLFVYLNKKQNSRAGIQAYREKPKSKSLIERITEISKNLSITNSLMECALLLNEHESLIAQHLELPRVQKSLFEDYTGVIKSLGAWGGDFVMATPTDDDSAYFQEKGFSTQFRGRDLFLL